MQAMILFLIALVSLRVEATSQSTLNITSGAPNGTLLKAFENPAITSIYLTADYNVDNEFEAYAGVKPPLPINRRDLVLLLQQQQVAYRAQCSSSQYAGSTSKCIWQ